MTRVPGGADAGDRVRLTVPATVRDRLDRFLAASLAGRSRSALRRLIVEGRVSVDGRHAAKPGLALEPGMEIVIDLPPPPSPLPLPEAIDFDVVFEDEALLVVNKPSGLVVHPGHGRARGTLVNALLGRGLSLSPLGAPNRPGIVHRLDRETSGLLIVAKSERAHAALASAFARREIRKRYEALVWGHPRPERGTIDARIGRSRANPVCMAVGGRGSREASTRYDTREHLTGFALLTLYPETGRTHQIRVHLQSIHHPLVGDSRYGGERARGVQDPLKRRALREFGRLALHASALVFRHPLDGREIALEQPLPPEFGALLDVLRKD